MLVSFGLRFALVAVTPLFFELPIRQYGHSSTRWLWLGALLIENLAFGFLALRRTNWLTSTKAGARIRVLDFAFAFVAFLATTRASSGKGLAYSDLVVIGAFQLQTYGPMVTTGALRGAWVGATAGVAAALLYPICLIALGRSAQGLVGARQIANTVGRSALYILIGTVFGLLGDLVTRLAHQRAKFRNVVTRRIEAKKRMFEAEHAAELARMQFEAAEELRKIEEDHSRELALYTTELKKRAYDVLHRRGLSELGVFAQALAALCDRNSRRLEQFLKGGLVAELQGISENIS